MTTPRFEAVPERTGTVHYPFRCGIDFYDQYSKTQSFLRKADPACCSNLITAWDWYKDILSHGGWTEAVGSDRTDSDKGESQKR